MQQRLPPELLLSKNLQKLLLLEKTISLDPAYERKCPYVKEGHMLVWQIVERRLAALQLQVQAGTVTTTFFLNPGNII